MNRNSLTNVFPLFAPNSAGDDIQKEILTIKSINQVIPFLHLLLQEFNYKVELHPIDYFNPYIDSNSLKNLFNTYGSDKSSTHDYYKLYASILDNRYEIKNICEIGLGSNNLDTVSNMGLFGRPGASLKAFKDYCPNAQIYGADIDERILIQDYRIKTCYIDQTEISSFKYLDAMLPNNLDLFIDDGLHAPNANLQTFRYGLNKIKVGGWVVIEDIPYICRPIWEIVSAILPSYFKGYLLQGKNALVFAVNKF